MNKAINGILMFLPPVFLPLVMMLLRELRNRLPLFLPLFFCRAKPRKEEIKEK
jgi:hypothetical protein